MLVLPEQMRSFYDNSEFPPCCTSGKMECLSTATYRVLLKTLNAPDGNVCMINTVGTERSPWNPCRPWLTQPPAGGTLFLFVFLRVTPKHCLPLISHRTNTETSTNRLNALWAAVAEHNPRVQGLCVNVSKPPGTPPGRRTEKGSETRPPARLL